MIGGRAIRGWCTCGRPCYEALPSGRLGCHAALRGRSCPPLDPTELDEVALKVAIFRTAPGPTWDALMGEARARGYLRRRKGGARAS